MEAYHPAFIAIRDALPEDAPAVDHVLRSLGWVERAAAAIFMYYLDEQ